jgi:hypothetical protein
MGASMTYGLIHLVTMVAIAAAVVFGVGFASGYYFRKARHE